MAHAVAPVIVCLAAAADPITNFEDVGLAPAEVARLATGEVQVAARAAFLLAFPQRAVWDHWLAVPVDDLTT